MQWTYPHDDPAVMLWTAARQRFGFDFRPSQRVLEVGCAETDWLERLHAADPTLTLWGVDSRPQERTMPMPSRIWQGDAMDSLLVPSCSCDWVVLLGALEHVGLGYYGDPEREDGDRQVMRNAADWLTPGGFLYFDVPCNRTGRITENRHYRIYTPADVTALLDVPGLGEVTRGYSLPEPWAGTWCEVPVRDRVPYHYAAVLAQKVVN